MAVEGLSNTMTAQFRSASTKKSNTELGLDDFLQLLSVQMRYQDVSNPMSNTEMMAQMAQYSTLSAIQEMTKQTNTSYSASLLGKEVTVARMSKTGQLETDSGVVTGVGLYESNPVVYVNDKAYYLAEIMVVGAIPVEKKSTENGTNPGDGGNTSTGE